MTRGIVSTSRTGIATSTGQIDCRPELVDYADVAPTSGRFVGAGRGRLTVDKQLGVTVAA
jgi:hypothetical protein